MRESYKNKRDEYKAKMEKYRQEADSLRAEVKRLTKKPNEGKRYKATTYCSTCCVVADYHIVIDQPVTQCTCPRCGSRTLLPAIKPDPFF
jgi:hypothetical protein